MGTRMWLVMKLAVLPFLATTPLLQTLVELLMPLAKALGMVVATPGSTAIAMVLQESSVLIALTVV